MGPGNKSTVPITPLKCLIRTPLHGYQDTIFMKQNHPKYENTKTRSCCRGGDRHEL